MSFTVLSPDGVPIAPMTYTSRDQAWAALAIWCCRYVAQGYYASVKGHIPLSELPLRCTIRDDGPQVKLVDPALLGELLEELLEYFDDRMDINDDGGPNKAMSFHTRITEVLG